MEILTSFILLFPVAIAASSATSLADERVSMAYWLEKLPTTVIPQTLSELIISSDHVDGKITLNVDNLGGMKASAGQESVAASLKRCDAGQVWHDATEIMPRNPSLCMLLLERYLVSGTKVSLTFLQESIPDAPHNHFLPRAVAEKIPFSSDKLSLALKELNIAPGSVMALAMKETLEACERPALKGETKFCATSLESMIDFITSKLGSNRLTVLAANVSKMSESVTQEYMIMGVKYEGKEEEAVYYCHSAQYPYAVYYCHSGKGTRVARVLVKGEDGSAVEAVAVCHKESIWNAWKSNNMAFRVLNVKHGAGSICHFALQGHVLWLSI